MSTMLLHSKRSRSRTFSNQSAAENDISQSLRRRSVQSINNFSFRRLLGNETQGHSLKSTSITETSKLLPKVTLEDSHTLYKSWESESSSSVIPSRVSKNQGSHHNQEDPETQYQVLLQADEPGEELRRSLLDYELHTNVERKLGTLSPPPSAATVSFRPLFSRKFQSMGNKASTILRRNPLKENQVLNSGPDVGKVQRRPASSPTSATPPLFSSLKIVIPDRRSSISPRPADGAGTLSLAKSSQLRPPTDPEIPAIHGPLPAQTTFSKPLVSHHPKSTSVKPLSPPAPTTAFQRHIPYLTLSLPTPAPPLTLAHFSCYQSHRHVHFSPNIHNPVPCMTCGNEGGRSRWKCQWCCLRICMSCMEVLGRTEGRDLGVMVGKLDEDGRGFMGGRLEDWGDRVERVWKDGDSVQNRERATKDEGAKEQEEAKTI